MTRRIQQFVSQFDEYKIDAYLVTCDVNVRYLTSLPVSESWLLVFPKKVFYITDFRYVQEARQRLKGICVRQYTKSMTETLFKIVREMKAKRLGFDDRYVSLALYKQMKKDCPGSVMLVAKNNTVETMREIKEKDEVQKIRAAIKINLKAYRYLKRVVTPGITEQNVLLKLERYVKSQGAEFSFAPIIASGPNSCFPHARVTNRRIRNNESVLIDMGIDIQGYKSDLTRIFFLGKISNLLRKMHDAVAMAQEVAIKKIKPGIPAAQIDQEARNYLKKHKLAKFFGHSLGHGVGLEVHEGPGITQRSGAILRKGMVFTVEPAVYIPHKFGIRIEDMVWVTHDGCEVLSRGA